MTEAAGVVKGAGLVKVAAVAGVASAAGVVRVGKSGKGGARACPGAVRRTRCRRCCTRRRGWRRPPPSRRPRLQRPAAGGRHWSRGRHDCAACAMCAAGVLHVRCMGCVWAPRCACPSLRAPRARGARLGREEDDGIDACELLEDEEQARDGHEPAVARAHQLRPAAARRIARLHWRHARARPPQACRRLLGLGRAPLLGGVGLGLGLGPGCGCSASGWATGWACGSTPCAPPGRASVATRAPRAARPAARCTGGPRRRTSCASRRGRRGRGGGRRRWRAGCRRT